jgi:hypothetical protein
MPILDLGKENWNLFHMVVACSQMPLLTLSMESGRAGGG